MSAWGAIAAVIGNFCAKGEGLYLPKGGCAPDRERADVPALVDDHERVGGELGDRRVEFGLGVGDAPAQELGSLGVDGVRPMEELPDVEAQVGVVLRCESCAGHGHGGALSARLAVRFAASRQPHYLAVEHPAPGRFLSAGMAAADSRWQHPPGLLERQGHKAIRERSASGPTGHVNIRLRIGWIANLTGAAKLLDYGSFELVSTVMGFFIGEAFSRQREGGSERESQSDGTKVSLPSRMSRRKTVPMAERISP